MFSGCLGHFGHVPILIEQLRHTDSEGNTKISGGPKLKETQHYPKLFGTAVFEMYMRRQESLCYQSGIR